jgi:NIPSNAP
MTKKLTEKTLTGIALSDCAETRDDARRPVSQCRLYALIRRPSPPVVARVEKAESKSQNPRGKWRSAMIFDHRTYELQPGRLREFLALHEKEGLPVQKKHLGNLVGFFTTEIGNVNEIVHIWAYEDLADRTKRRAAMAGDPAWQAYLQKSREYMKHMNNKILVPTSFSPTN